MGFSVWRLLLAAFLQTSLAVLVPRQAAPINTPAPMLEPSYPACMQFHLAGNGEDCNSIIGSSGLERTEFFRINPGVGGERHCQDKIIPNTWYCVLGMGGSFGGGDDKPPPAGKTLRPEPMDGPHNPMAPHTTKPRRPHTTTKPKAPATTTSKAKVVTDGPDAGQCWWGGCWDAFLKLSESGHRDQSRASSLCTRLFNEPCGNHDSWNFPGEVLQGCTNCGELSSGCPCYTEGMYKTVYYWGPDDHGFDGDPDYSYPGPPPTSRILG